MGTRPAGVLQVFAERAGVPPEDLVALVGPAGGVGLGMVVLTP